MPIDFRRFDKSSHPLYRAIADELARQIKRGDLQAGERLLTHRELSTLLGIARSTVRHAYQELGRRRLVETGFGRGTFVRDTRSGLGFGSASRSWKKFTIDLATNRCCLEAESVPDWLSGRCQSSTHPERREALGLAGTLWLEKHGLKCPADSVVPCAGSHHGIVLSMLACTSAGDRVAVDCLTYPGVRQIGEMLDREIVPIDLDEHGTEPESLERVCREYRPQLVYLMPTLHNPTSNVMPASRREEIGRILGRYETSFLEDDSRRLYSEPAPDPLTSWLPDQGIYMAGFSKMVGAGARLGFLSVPDDLQSRLRDALWATVSSLPSALMDAATELIDSGAADDAVARSRHALRERRAAAARILGPGLIPQNPLSPYLWIGVPPGRNSEQIAAEALEAGVRILPATPFAVDRNTPDAVRLCITGPRLVEDLEAGLRRLADPLGFSSLMTPLLRKNLQDKYCAPRKPVGSGDFDGR